jgi:dynein light intermediate chain 1
LLVFTLAEWAADVIPTLQPHSLPPFNSPTPEQAFLAKNYDENAKKPDRDPRGAFKNPSEMAGTAAAGIVGPLGSSSFSLPAVERALSEMDVGVGPTGSADARRRATGRPPSSTLAALGATVSVGNHGAGRAGTSPTLSSAGSPSPTSGQTQHEVLQNFFQSLLSSKDRASGGGSAASSRHNVPKTNGTGGGTEDATS